MMTRWTVKQMEPLCSCSVFSVYPQPSRCFSQATGQKHILYRGWINGSFSVIFHLLPLLFLFLVPEICQLSRISTLQAFVFALTNSDLKSKLQHINGWVSVTSVLVLIQILLHWLLLEQSDLTACIYHGDVTQCAAGKIEWEDWRICVC